MTIVADVASRRAALAERFSTWPQRTLSVAFDDAVARFPNRTMFVNEQGGWTYAAMQDWSRRLAKGLLAWGVKRGDHVALLMANYSEFVALKLAIARVGAVTIPINFNLRGEELRYIIDQSDAVLLLTMKSFREHDYVDDLDTLAPGWRNGTSAALPTLREVVVRTVEEGRDTGLRSIDALEALGNDVDEEVLRAAEEAGEADSNCDILYTSGTTGRPKGVMLSHDMVLRAAYASALHRAFEDGRSMLHALPMYHVFGYIECLVASWYVGGKVVTQLTFEAETFLDLAEEHRITDLVALPNMTMKLLDTVSRRGFDSSALLCVFNSGGVNPPSIWRDIRAWLKPVEMHTGYGMSETTASTVSSLPEGDDAQLATSNGRYKIAGAAGDPATGGHTAEYKVVDPESGQVMPFGQIGELMARGPVVTTGYYGKPDETAAAFTDGWLHTGDLGRLTEDGYLTLTGRLKESYRCGGEMVMPREVEALFDDHPDIALALAVGVPDSKMGEVGCLCVVPKAGSDPDPASLLALVASRLARFKVPRHVLILSADEIPMTSTGRPQKVKLAEMAARILAAAAD